MSHKDLFLALFSYSFILMTLLNILVALFAYLQGIPAFLAHRIRISEILPWNRKSYLTHAIFPRLSRVGYIHWLYWNFRTLSSSDVIVMLK